LRTIHCQTAGGKTVEPVLGHVRVVEKQAQDYQRHRQDDALSGHRHGISHVESPPFPGTDLQASQDGDHDQRRRNPGELATKTYRLKQVTEPNESDHAYLGLV